MTKPRALLGCLAAFFIPIASTNLCGQTSAPANGAAASSDQTNPPTGVANPPSEETVQLSAFEVKDTKDAGYFARESVSGMKTKEPLMDSPGNIIVVPRDLIDDVGEPESASDTLKFVASGIDPYVRGEQMQIRGARTGFTLVDDIPDLMFFADNVGVDSYEVLKGPTAVLYGPTSAIFGLVIKTQKKPLPDFKGDFDTTVGNNGYVRTELDVTGPLAAGFSYRLIGAYQKYPDLDPRYMDNRKILIGTLQWANSNTTLRFSYEHGDIETGDSNDLTMVNYETGPEITPYISPFGKYFVYAPDNGRLGYNGLYSNDVRATAIHIWSENWQTRLFFDRTLTDRPSVNYPGLASYSIVNDSFTLYWDNYDENFISTVWGTDNIGKYGFAGINFQSNFGFLYNNRDGTSYDEYTPVWATGSLTHPQNFNAIPLPATYPAKPNNFVPGPSETAYFLETLRPIPNSDRVILNGGLSRVVVNGVDAKPEALQTVSRAGVVVKPVQDVSLYYYYSTRFNPSSYTDRSYYGTQFPNVIGAADEAGIKTDLFHHRLIVTVDAYKMTQNNQLIPGPGVSPVTGLGYYVFVGDTKDTGVEFDAEVEPIQNWQLILVAWKGDVLNSAGVAVDGSIGRNAGFYTRYNFPSDVPLKGLAIGGGVYYNGRRYFLSTQQYDPPYTEANIFVDYRLNRHWSAALNVSNITNAFYIEGAWSNNEADFGEPRDIRFTLHYRW